MNSDSIKKEGSIAEPGMTLDIAKFEEGQSFADIDKISERSYGERHLSRNRCIEVELIKGSLKSEN
jgi:hypothetical protein